MEPSSTTTSTQNNWNPSYDQKKRAASDTWNLYKGAGSGTWMGGADDAYQIRGVERAGDPGYVDFEYRSADGTGPTTYYGTLNSKYWNDPGAAGDQWSQDEINQFYNRAGAMQNAWGTGYGWNSPPPAGPGAETPPPVTPPGTGPTYTPPTGGVPIGGEDAAKYGLGWAKKLFEQALGNQMTYPDWWGNDYSYFDPEKWANKYPEFIRPNDYQTVANPGEYQGLMEGDYNRLEQSLRQPGETAAQNAYSQGLQDLNAFMGNSGMYGSSVMGQQANNGINSRYMDTLASNAANAASQRYGMQQADQQFGANYGLQRSDFMRQQAMDKWKADLTNQSLLRDYNSQRFNFDFQNSQAARGERNSLLQQKFQHQLQQVNWANMLNEQLMNRALAMAGQGAPLSNAAMNYRAQQDNNDAAATAAKWRLGGDIIGGLAGFGSEGGWGGSLGKGAWDAVSGLWGNKQA